MEEHLESSWAAASQAERLQVVLVLGRTWQGWKALKRLFRVIILETHEDAMSFLNAGTATSWLADHFEKVSHGESLNLYAFTTSIYFAFESGPYITDFYDSFRVYLSMRLGFMTSLRLLTFEISEYDYNWSFLVMTDLANEYPASLRRVRMVSTRTRVSSSCPRNQMDSQSGHGSH